MEATFSDHWYRVAGLHPQLRLHVRIDRHCYRDEVWHVLHDTVGGRRHRLNAAAYAVVGRFDGRLSVQQIWELAVAELGDAAPTQPEMIALLARLHEAELIRTEEQSDVAALFDRHERRSRQRRRERMNPLAPRIALFDPSPVLDALAPLAALLARRWALGAWALLVLAALAAAAVNARELQHYATLHLRAPAMLLTLWLAYPLIKAAHELAHGLAVRVWGGEVREMGVGLLVLMPVPYVDASAASSFRERHRRVLVSLAGIIAETTLAALALFVWLGAADGTLRHAAFAVVLIGGVSTLLFNGNPLMRFDAYYALADALESPGLATRSRAWWLYQARRRLFGVAHAQPPAIASRERRWLIGYGAAATIWRWVVMVLVVGWLAQIHLWLAAAALMVFAWALAIQPLARLTRYLARSPELIDCRGRALAATVLGLGLPLAVLVAVPVPSATTAAGVVWAPPQAQVRSDGEGFVQRVWVQDGQLVAAGEPVLALMDPTLAAERSRAEARLRALDVAYHAAVFEQPAAAGAIEQEIARAQAELERVLERQAALTIHAPAAGRIALAHEQDLPGRFVARGSLVAHVIEPVHTRLRVVVAHDDVARLAQSRDAIEVRLADSPRHTLQARWVGQAPAATRTLPSVALAHHGGGRIATDPADPEHLRALQPLFTVDLELPTLPLERLGTRAWARFDHGSEPLAAQGLRRLRQVFVGRLGAAGATG